MSPLQNLLDTFRTSAHTEREKGTYFEELILNYFRLEASYKDLYSDVWTYADWATETMGNARYQLELFQRVITVNLETLRILASLPKLDIE